MKKKTKYYFYILKCKDKTLYCGIAKDIQKRLRQHNSGKGSAYVRSRGGGTLVYSESCKNLSVALKREIEVKKRTRSEKLKLVSQKAKLKSQKFNSKVKSTSQ